MAATRLRIHCGRCGNFWEIYFRDNWKADSARVCPHCGAEIDSQTWENNIVPAFTTVSDANNELFKDSSGYGQTRFSIDVIASKEHNYRRNY